MTQGASTLQDFPLQSSVEAVKASLDFAAYDDFRRHLIEHLPYNSPQTRRRYADLIGHRYFPGQSLSNLLTDIWRPYQDDAILADIMRVYALEAEPVIANFLLQYVAPLAVGSHLDPAAAPEYISATYGRSIAKSCERLLQTLNALGFLGRYSGTLIVKEVLTPADAFLLLLHDRLAPTPRIVRLSDILETRWWQFLGLKEPEAVRAILRRAEIAGLVARYALVDELEQVTTRYARDSYIEQAKRL